MRFSSPPSCGLAAAFLLALFPHSGEPGPRRLAMSCSSCTTANIRCCVSRLNARMPAGTPAISLMTLACNSSSSEPFTPGPASIAMNATSFDFTAARAATIAPSLWPIRPMRRRSTSVRDFKYATPAIASSVERRGRACRDCRSSRLRRGRRLAARRRHASSGRPRARETACGPSSPPLRSCGPDPVISSTAGNRPAFGFVNVPASVTSAAAR